VALHMHDMVSGAQAQHNQPISHQSAFKTTDLSLKVTSEKFPGQRWPG
jgi:hypothetical protein